MSVKRGSQDLKIIAASELGTTTKKCKLLDYTALHWTAVPILYSVSLDEMVRRLHE